MVILIVIVMIVMLPMRLNSANKLNESVRQCQLYILHYFGTCAITKGSHRNARQRQQILIKYFDFKNQILLTIFNRGRIRPVMFLFKRIVYLGVSYIPQNRLNTDTVTVKFHERIVNTTQNPILPVDLVKLITFMYNCVCVC